MRTIGVVTTARADYGPYLPVLREIRRNSTLQLRLLVSGMHLSPEFGMTVKDIEADGFEIADRVEMLLSSDTPEGIAKSMGLGTIGFAQTFVRFRPDILLVLGDRFEMHAAVVAALPFRIPIAHIAGGEATEGLIDEAIRHSVTKMSHLHFPTTRDYANRIVNMGEEPWRVKVCGAPGLDNMRLVKLLTPEEMFVNHGLNIAEPFLLVTYHPVTLEYQDTGFQMTELLSALESTGLPVIFTYPNADTSGRLIIEMINRFITTHGTARVAVNLGTQGYLTLMQHAAAMVGNSSSGIIEAASFRLPVVNIGIRQRGRMHDRNVIDTGYGRDDLARAIDRAISPQFRDSLVSLVNPYGDGHAAGRIVETLASIDLNERLLIKRFHDLMET